MFKLTKRNVVKYGAHTLVCQVAHQITKATINTILDPADASSETVELASGAVGIGVTSLTWNATDRFVDRVADWRTSRKDTENEPALTAVA